MPETESAQRLKELRELLEDVRIAEREIADGKGVSHAAAAEEFRAYLKR